MEIATYKQIKDYIEEQFGYTPRSTWIAHAKEIYGLNPKMAATRRSADERINPCPQEKKDNLRQAFEHFEML